MSSYALRIEGVGKEYLRGVRRDDTLRDFITGAASRVLKHKPSASRFWALRDITFDVRPGEVIGLIGHNGAGKSTLLKILSRITKPTTGRIEISGRISSLLEVGTGFHPELSGRENIYLNGSILGMSRRDIDQRFDEIVDFANIEAFLETPLKRYSSGMQVRLAFAVAAHLEPDILLVDEVLAVGDAEFQQKCLRKMGQVSTEGRTIVFVSHHMGAIQNLCTRGVLFRDGQVEIDADVSTAVSRYLAMVESYAAGDLATRTDRRGKGPVRLTAVNVSGASSGQGGLITGEATRFAFRLSPPKRGIHVLFTIYDKHGSPVTSFASDPLGPFAGEYVTCHVDELLLVPGRYRVNVAVYNHDELQDHLEGATYFEVGEGHMRGRVVQVNGRYGSVYMPHSWAVPVAESAHETFVPDAAALSSVG